ncbi:hypothetical protein SRHO_G00211620 [Serrasalmus rhombeus]
MDDQTVTTESVPGCRWILKGFEKLMKWARMRFEPAKSRSMVLRKGKGSLKDSTSIQSTCAELDGWLKSVDKSGLPGKFKAWVYQHGVLPRILWPILVYAIPICTAET